MIGHYNIPSMPRHKKTYRKDETAGCRAPRSSFLYSIVMWFIYSGYGWRHVRLRQSLPTDFRKSPSAVIKMNIADIIRITK